MNKSIFVILRKNLFNGNYKMVCIVYLYSAVKYIYSNWICWIQWFSDTSFMDHAFRFFFKYYFYIFIALAGRRRTNKIFNLIQFNIFTGSSFVDVVVGFVLLKWCEKRQTKQKSEKESLIHPLHMVFFRNVVVSFCSH